MLLAYLLGPLMGSTKSSTSATEVLTSAVNELGREARIVSSRGGGGLGLARIFGGWLEPARGD